MPCDRVHGEGSLLGERGLKRREGDGETGLRGQEEQKKREERKKDVEMKTEGERERDQRWAGPF